jgi:hypothetical protein
MLSVTNGSRNPGGLTRRQIVKVGGLSLFSGLSLPRLIQAREASEGQGSSRRIESVILLNLFGGPSHLDIFDMKPDAPVEIRGEFRPIPTTVPGLQVCEHLPKLAARMHRATLIRTVSHNYNSHNPYGVLTGFTDGVDNENFFTKRTDHPGIGSVCQYLGMGLADMPCQVYLPSHPGYSQGLRRAGPYGGYLGAQYDPVFGACDPKFDREFNPEREFFNPITAYGAPSLPKVDDLPDLTVERLNRRHSLLEQVDHVTARLEGRRDVDTLSQYQRKALTILTSSRARAAFDLSRESAANKARYGPTLFGSSLLLARRLVEAGVVFVAVTTESRGAGHWDTHMNNFPMLKTSNLPNLDQISAALVDDLDERGLLDSTLVVIMGEMGRAPKINGSGGRDHWPQVGWSLLFGGGTKQGFVFGASDKQGAYPIDHPVSPGDLVATIYRKLGVNHELVLPDLTGRPIPISHGGMPIREIFA